MVRRGSTSTALREIYLLLLQSGHGHWSHPQPVHAFGSFRDDIALGKIHLLQPSFQRRKRGCVAAARQASARTHANALLGEQHDSSCEEPQRPGGVGNRNDRPGQLPAFWTRAQQLRDLARYFRSVVEDREIELARLEAKLGSRRRVCPSSPSG